MRAARSGLFVSSRTLSNGAAKNEKCPNAKRTELSGFRLIKYFSKLAFSSKSCYLDLLRVV